MVGNNSICYEAVQRIFRNCLVDYLRVRLNEIFPNDHVQRLKKPLLKEWEGIEASAKACRLSGGTETAVKDEYDLLSVAHFYNVFEAYFDKLYSASVMASGQYPKPSKSKLLGNLKSIKDLRDPLSHPVEQDISYEEAFGILTDVKQVLTALGLTESASKVSLLMHELCGLDTHSAADIVCSLPTQDSIYLDFVGRREVLRSLEDWFSSPTNKRCLLAGDGGKGKSAVAYKFAQQLSQKANEYKLIAWLSAKRRKFEDGRAVQIDTPDFTDIQSALDRMLMHFGILPEADDVRSNDQKKERLLEYLNEYPSFLIVDDIDTVLSDTEVVGLFTFEIPSTRSKVLLTSRRDIPGIKGFTIKGFEIPEAEDFIKSRIELYGLDPAGFPIGVAKGLVAVTDGSPLYMDDLLRLARMVPVAQAITIWRDKKGDEARRYALQRAGNALERCEKGVDRRIYSR